MTRAICLAIVLLSLGNIPRFWRRSAALTQSADPWGIAARHTRFAALSARLGTAKSVGFITAVADAATGGALYFDAAYELAPRFVLVNDTRPHEFIAGSFPAPVDPGLVAQATGLLVVEEAGGGVVLFRRP